MPVNYKDGRMGDENLQQEIQVSHAYTLENSHLPFQQNERRGRHVAVPPMATHSPSAVRKAREASLQVKGARLFNLIPMDLRNVSGV